MMNDPSAWEDEVSLIRHLARELVAGRLLLVLGAGVSQFYGLPSWESLVGRITEKADGTTFPSGGNPLTRIEAIRATHFQDDNSGFMKAVKDALYEGVSLDFQRLRDSQLLAALGSLVMASRRGSASTVITFNYDDLLENYLEFHGFMVDSLFEPIHWAGRYDVKVYHPHGFLPISPSRSDSASIVLGLGDYLDILSSGSGNIWRSTLQSILRTHTSLYIGLSGEDLNLQSLIREMASQHPIIQERLAFHGVRFDLKTPRNADTAPIMKGWKVFTHVIASYDDIPPFLFRLCQAARKIRINQDNS